MPGMKGTSSYYENYLNQLGGYLGQHQVNTGRTATPEMVYGATSGALSPLLQYDIARRRQQIANMQWWQARHDARKGTGDSFTGIVKGLMAAMQNMGGGGGGGGSTPTDMQGGSGVAGMDYSAGGFGDWMAASGSTYGANGLVVDEPIVGYGQETGQRYVMGEAGKQEVLVPTDVNQSSQPSQYDFWSLFNTDKTQQQGAGTVDASQGILGQTETMKKQAQANSVLSNKPSTSAKNAQSITQGIAGIAKLIASYYTGNYGLAKSGGQDLMGAVSTQLD